tara:strand:+ start:4108 stop:4653 length:546 start_codon:yes stop_codon:yes gene_type:complete
MSYKLYTDKQEVFECTIHLEGASLSEATARLVVESDNYNLMFEGTIDKKGNCKVPVKKLKNVLKENDKGIVKLEVIAEDTYFLPWESEFEVDTSKKIKVEVKEQQQPKTTKPRIKITEIKQDFNPVNKIVDVLKQKGVTPQKLVKTKSKIMPTLKEYAIKSGYKKNMSSFLKEVVYKLSKK